MTKSAKRPSFIQAYNQRMSGMANNYARSNSYAVGNRIYNGVSNSPHAGAGGVNPAGYATRDRMAATKRNYLADMLRKGKV